MSVGLSIMLVGLAQTLVAWLFFRLHGVAFWTIAPVWRAKQYLDAVGASLWVGGVTTGFVGLAIEFLPRLA